MALKDHALACALYGDCIFDEVLKGATVLEQKWKAHARAWDGVFAEAVRTGFLGWGKPLVSPHWLSHVLFNQRQWPKGLSKDERDLLKLAASFSGYRDLRDHGKVRDRDLLSPEGDERTLAAMKKLAEGFQKQIALPMYKDYASVARAAAKAIAPMCDARYNEPCSEREALSIFKGDLERGLKVDTLNIDPESYRVLENFIEWVSV